MNFCSHCGQPITLTVPSGDDRPRHVCTHCDRVHYQNPRIITGCLPVYENRVLLCKRSIEPRLGLWTLPAGFLENGETVAEGALRESREEANLNARIERLYSVVDIPHINQVYMLHLAAIESLDFSPGAESEETRLFHESEIPWDALAFSAVEWTLRRYFEDRASGTVDLHCGVMQPSRKYGYAHEN